MKDFKTTITSCITMNLLDKVETPCSKEAIKKQVVNLLGYCSDISQQANDWVFKAIDQYSDKELKELEEIAINRVIDAYNNVTQKETNEYHVVGSTLDNIRKVEHLCFNAWYPELPDLLFGTVNGIDVFNASEFLRRRKSDKHVEDFFNSHKAITAYKGKIKPEEIRIDYNGDILLNAYLSFAFVEYADPNFMLYMHDRIHELFSNGVLFSDNYLAVAAKQRLPKKVLNQLAS